MSRYSHAQPRALAFKLFTIQLRQSARSGYDRLRLGTRTGERLAASFALSTLFVFAVLGVCVAAKLPTNYALAGGGAVLLFFFGISAILILWGSDGQLADDRVVVEEELRYARRRAFIADKWREDRERAEERRRQEEEEEERHNRRRRELRDDGYRCPYCRTREYPEIRSKISAAGWVFFWLTCLFLCWPICWIGLLITHTYRECPACGARS
jgi:hypothetical protein